MCTIVLYYISGFPSTTSLEENRPSTSSAGRRMPYKRINRDTHRGNIDLAVVFPPPRLQRSQSLPNINDEYPSEESVDLK